MGGGGGGIPPGTVLGWPFIGGGGGILPELIAAWTFFCCSRSTVGVLLWWEWWFSFFLLGDFIISGFGLLPAKWPEFLPSSIFFLSAIKLPVLPFLLALRLSLSFLSVSIVALID